MLGKFTSSALHSVPLVALLSACTTESGMDKVSAYYGEAVVKGCADENAAMMKKVLSPDDSSSERRAYQDCLQRASGKPGAAFHVYYESSDPENSHIYYSVTPPPEAYFDASLLQACAAERSAVLRFVCSDKNTIVERNTLTHCLTEKSHGQKDGSRYHVECDGYGTSNATPVETTDLVLDRK